MKLPGEIFATSTMESWRAEGDNGPDVFGAGQDCRGGECATEVRGRLEQRGGECARFGTRGLAALREDDHE